MRPLMCLLSLMLVLPLMAQEPQMTPDEALILEAPEGWMIEIENFEQAEDDFDLNIDFPGISIRLIPDNNATALTTITLYYGQDWQDAFGVYILSDDEAVFSDPEQALLYAMEAYSRIPLDEIMLETFTLNNGQVVYYFDLIDTLTRDQFDTVDFSGVMSDVELGMDSETLNESFEESVDVMGDTFDSITSVSRYYALSYENTGVIFIEVLISTDIESDNDQVGAMMDMMSATEADIAPVIEEILNQMQSGPGKPIYDDVSNQNIIADSADDSTMGVPDGLILPPDWVVLPTDIENRIELSNDPSADLNTFTFAPDKAIILIQLNERARAIYEDEGISFDLSLETIMEDIALVEQDIYGLSETPEVTTVQIGALTTYSLSFSFEPYILTEYFYKQSDGGFVQVAVLTQQAMSADLLRSVAIILNSLG